MIGKPSELVKAELIENLCQRYHITPDKALRLDASVLRHIAILNLAYPPGEQPGAAY